MLSISEIWQSCSSDSRSPPPWVLDLDLLLGTSTAMLVMVDFLSTSLELGEKAAGLGLLPAAANCLLVFRCSCKNLRIRRSVTYFLKSGVQ